MCMVLEGVLAALNTPISHATCVHGNQLCCMKHVIDDHLRKLLFCRVTLGKPCESLSAFRMAHAPPGHHSVVGVPSLGGLAFSEFVIYRGEQVRIEDHVTWVTLHHCLQAYPEYLITYKIIKPS